MRVKPYQIDTAGAAAGNALVYDPAADEYAPGSPIDTTAEAERIRDVIGAALVQGNNVTITVNDAGDTITIAAASATSSELLMQDGVTSPPVPIENEAGDDWLYQD